MKREDVEIGSVVKIKDPGKIYSTYTEWVKKYAPAYVDNYVCGHSPSSKECEEDQFEIVGCGEHQYEDAYLIAIRRIQRKENSSSLIYVIGVKGVQLISQKIPKLSKRLPI